MKTSALNSFVKKAMGINADYAGMGGASAAIIGGSGTNAGVINDLRRNVIAFASEYSKNVPDQSRLKKLGKELTGSFLALKMINAISDARLEELESDLNSLLRPSSRTEK